MREMTACSDCAFAPSRARAGFPCELSPPARSVQGGSRLRGHPSRIALCSVRASVTGLGLSIALVHLSSRPYIGLASLRRRRQGILKAMASARSNAMSMRTGRLQASSRDSIPRGGDMRGEADHVRVQREGHEGQRNQHGDEDREDHGAPRRASRREIWVSA